MMSSAKPHAQSGTRILWGTGAAEYAALMWAATFGKARDAGFIAMSRMSTIYRMMVASSAYSAARLMVPYIVDTLCILLYLN